MRKLSVDILVILLWLVLFPGCNSRKAPHYNITSREIDSLIEIQKIHEKCLLIKFGADAITVIDTKKGFVVIDAGISSDLTARYRKIIENEYNRNYFTYVINTHGHPDHIGGSRIFPESGIVGHVNILQEIPEGLNNAEERLKSLCKTVEYYELQLEASESNTAEWKENFTQRTRYLYACNEAKELIPVKHPDITFSDKLNIGMDDVTFEMIYFGKFHSNSDILIHVPEMNILFTGDLFSRYGRPSINDTLMAEKDKWQNAVQWLEERMTDIEVIIDGHGEILSKDDLKSFRNNILKKSSM